MIDREKLKEKLRLNNQRLMERARNLVRSTAEEEEEAPSTTRSAGPNRPQKKAKIMDFYKMEQHYNYRSSSFVDRREQSIQTKADDRAFTSKRTASVLTPFQVARTTEHFKNSLLGAIRGSADRDSRTRSKQIDPESMAAIANPQEPEKKVAVIDLEPEKRQQILTSQVFGEYFSEASKFIEKIIGQEDDSGTAAKKAQRFDKIIPEVESELVIDLPVSFKNGIVNHLAWSPLIQDVFLTVYSEPVDTNVYDKLLIWNVNFKHRPEFELYSNSKIQTAVFSPFSTEIIVAGLESGRVCIYDLRAKKEPVVKSGISNDAHKAQITGLQFIGTANSSNLVSTSEEGRLCIWPSGKLETPRKVDLLYQEKKENVEDYAFAAEPLCISSIPGDISSVFVGTSEGKIYQCITESAQLDQAQRFYSQVFSDHGAVVSSLHMSPLNTSATELSGLMVSGSLDWTVKLWNPKSPKPITTFEYFKDPVSDVHWNHAFPGVFSAASVNGNVAIYDLMNDFENPSITFDFGDCVLNAKWDPTGKLLAISDNAGKVAIKRFRADAFQHGAADIENLETTIRYQNR
jgi:dynein intermediate chain